MQARTLHARLACTHTHTPAPRTCTTLLLLLLFVVVVMMLLLVMMLLPWRARSGVHETAGKSFVRSGLLTASGSVCAPVLTEATWPGSVSATRALQTPLYLR